MEEQEKEILGDGETQLQIRAYVLGTLTDAARQAIEERLMTDPDFSDILMVAENEVIENYLDQELTPVERVSFEGSYLTTPQGNNRLRLTRTVREYAKAKPKSAPEPVPGAKEKEKSRPSFFRRFFATPWPTVAVVAPVLAVSVLTWFAFFRVSETDQINLALNRAFKNQRPFQSRVSGLDYAPVGTTRGDRESHIDRRALEKAESLARDAAMAKETAETLRNEGRVFLLKGDAFDRAIDSLEKAKRLAPQNAEIWNELGAAELEQGTSLPQTDPRGSELRANALASFAKALELDPNLLPAYFNRALCLQAMSLPAQSKSAWQEYLKRDGASPWANEARQYLGQIQSSQIPAKSGDEILHDFLTAYRANNEDEAYRIVSRNREMITGKLVPQRLIWLFLQTTGTEQQETLAALNYVGRLELEKSGDPYFSQLARYYSSANPQQLDLLRTAQAAVCSGYDWSLKTDYKRALNSFDTAATAFAQAGDTWERQLCEYWRGYFLNRQGLIRESIVTLQSLALFSKREGFVWLGAQANAWLGIDMLATNEYSKAISHDREARTLAAQVSDLYLNQKATSQLAEVYRTMGDYVKAFNLFHEALRTAETPDASRRQKCRDLDVTADMYVALRNYTAATAYKNESLAIAEQLNERTFLTTEYLGLGVIAGAQGRYDEADRFFERSRQIAAGFDDLNLRQRSDAIIDLQAAHAQRQAGDYSLALRSYNRAASFFDTNDYNAFSYDAHKGRLLCYYQIGDDASFRAELPIILDQFKKFRRAITSEQNRTLFFDNEQTVYDIAVAYEYDRKNYDQAFTFSEESRARSLLDMQGSGIEVSHDEVLPEITLPPNITQPRTLSEIQATMPANVQLVQYSALEKKTLIWLINKNSYRVVESDTSYAGLQDKVIAYLNLLPQNRNSLSVRMVDQAKELYSYLLTPIETELDPDKEICFIPDKILFRLPFAALVSPKTGKYLIADHTISTSPSASNFLLSTAQATARSQGGEETVLSVGNPSFNQEDFDGLLPLGDATREATEISHLYAHKALLVELEATKERIRQNLASANVIHIAAHYLVNQTWPLLSGLVLASVANSHKREDSLMANFEIVREKLSRARLIVLSACQTGVERFYNGEGMIGAARSFLAAGVPLVVASEWDVDSEATAVLMISFHRYRKLVGLSTVEALRRSQLDMLNGANETQRNPYYWAGFEAIGGTAKF